MIILLANKTTTVFVKTWDIAKVRSLGMHRQGANNGSMNLLNGDKLWDQIASKFPTLADGRLSIENLRKVQEEFFKTVNLPWLKEAVQRGDAIRVVSDPKDKALLYNNLVDDSNGLTTFGMEVKYLLDEGYEFINGYAVKKQ